MIGMMNGGSDAPVDFYSTPRTKDKGVPRLYTPQQREVVSYTKDGRMMLDGQLVVTETPEELWQDLIMRVCWFMLCKEHLVDKEFKMPQERKFRNFFRSTFNPKNFTQRKSSTSKSPNVMSAASSCAGPNGTTTMTTTTTSVDPRTGAKTVTQTTTTSSGKGGACKQQSQSMTSIFLRKKRFTASGNSAEPQQKRIVGR